MATSVPLPIAKPTFAFFRAGASLTPSPVIPTIKSISSIILTKRDLSLGRALATTFKLLIFLFNSSSLISFSSLLVKTKSSFSNRPASLAIAQAVSLASPVIIIILIPALLIKFTPSLVSTRNSSLIATIPIKVRLSKLLVLL